MFIEKRYPTASLDELSICGGEYGAQSSAIEYHPNRPRYVRITDINEDGSLNNDYASSANIKDDEQYRLKYGDFLFARMGATVGKTYAYTFGDQIYAGYLIRYRLNLEKILPEYLFAFTRLNCYWKWVSINQNGAAQPGINAKKYGSLYVPVPRIEEQKKFIELSQQIDKSKFLLQQILEKFELLKKSRFIELIGNIQNPKYQLVELNEICEFIKDGTHQTPIYTEDRVNGFKFLSSKDVTSQKINWSNIKYIPKELHEQLYAKLSPKRGDILLAKNGTTGVAAVVDSDEIFDIYVSLALLRPKSGVNVSYLCSALNSEDLKRQFNSSLKGIGVPNLHLREIKKARIIFPPIDIQNKISSITKQIDKSKFNVFQDQTASQVKVIVVLHHIC